MKVMLLMSENWTIFSDRDLPALVDAAKLAEAAGIDALGVSEHIVLGPNANATGAAKFNPRDFDAPGNQDPFTPWPSSIVLLSAFAAATSRIELHAGAIIPVLRHPLHIANDLASLDLLSRGRLVVYPTVSWQEEEYRALGQPFNKRGRMLDEHLAIWRKVWTESPASFDGEFYQIDRMYLEPKPWRANGPQIWITGGTLHPAALRRIVEYGDGFAPGYRFVGEDMARIREAMLAAGRDPGALDICAPVPGFLKTPDGVADIAESMALVPAMRDIGVTMIVLKPSQFVARAEDFGPFCADLSERLRAMG